MRVFLVINLTKIITKSRTSSGWSETIQRNRNTVYTEIPKNELELARGKGWVKVLLF